MHIIFMSRTSHIVAGCDTTGSERASRFEDGAEERTQGGERGGENADVEFDAVPDEVGIVACGVGVREDGGLEYRFDD